MRGIKQGQRCQLQPLCMPPSCVIEAHLKSPECLWWIVGADLGEKWGGLGGMQGWFWAKVGLDWASVGI